MSTLAITTKPGKKYRSIRKPKVYEALRRQGMSKQRAARISNAQAQKSFTLDQLEAFVCSPHYDSATAAAIASGVAELPRLKGETIAPGITRIHGNLCNVHGKYGRCPGAPAVTAPKPRGLRTPRKGRTPPKPKQTPEQRATARQQQRATNAADVATRMQQSDTGLSSSGVAGMRGLATGAQPPKNIGENLVTMGLAEQAQDGSYRMSATGRAAMGAMAAGDYQRTVDTISRAGDTAANRRTRQTATATRQQGIATRRAQTAANREQARRQRLAKQQARAAGKKPSGGGKKTPAKAAPSRTPARAAPRRSTATGGGASSGGSSAPAKAPAKQIAPALTEAAQNLSDGKTMSDADTQALIRNGLARLVKGQLVLTAAGQRQTTKAEEYGGVKRTNLDDSIFAGPDRSFPIKTAQDVRNAVMSLGRTKHDKAAVKRGIIRRARAIGAMDALPDSWKTTKDFSFRVFKDATGRDRWVAQSSTAYQDRDKEIVSTKALADDCRFADKHHAYGPLRWWHTPGLDLGDCDFNAMHGKILIESGTFRTPYIAQKVAAAADALEISLGFLHLPTEPDASGVFHHIRRFERSLVPRGKASNRFTAFRVKERLMFDPTKVAALKTLGFSDADITNLQETAEATEKAADAQNVAYKADDVDVIEHPDLEINGVTYKAFPPKAAAAAPAEGSPEEEAAEPPEEEQAELDAGEIDSQDTGGLTLSPEDISAIGQAVSDALTTALGPLVSTMDLTNKIGNHMNDLKSMMGGYQTKKDATDAEKAEQIAALQVSLKATQAKLDELLGLQPAVPPRASEAVSSIVNPFNPADNALLQSIKDQVPADQLPQYSNEFEDLKLKLFGA